MRGVRVYEIGVREADALDGRKRSLAPGGHRLIDQCQRTLRGLQAETRGYSSLFKNLSRCELEEGDLYGVGLSLERVSRKLGEIADRLHVATIPEDFV